MSRRSCSPRCPSRSLPNMTLAQLRAASPQAETPPPFGPYWLRPGKETTCSSPERTFINGSIDRSRPFGALEGVFPLSSTRRGGVMVIAVQVASDGRASRLGCGSFQVSIHTKALYCPTIWNSKEVLQPIQACGTFSRFELRQYLVVTSLSSDKLDATPSSTFLPLPFTPNTPK